MFISPMLAYRRVNYCNGSHWFLNYHLEMWNTRCFPGLFCVSILGPRGNNGVN